MRQKVVEGRLTVLLVSLSALAGAASCSGDSLLVARGMSDGDLAEKNRVLRPRASLVAIEIQTRENTLDGCLDCGCRPPGALAAAGEAQSWWIAFGQVRSDAKEGWVATAAPSRCGQGAFKNIASSFAQTLGAPYLIADVAIIPRALSSGQVEVSLEIEKKQLQRFDSNQDAVYANSISARKFRLAADDQGVPVPLLIPSARETQAFNIHEIVLYVNAQAVGRDSASSYGTILVRGDVPGAKILVDGGYVGRVAEDRPVRVENILAGTWDVQVEGFSGRKIRRSVEVVGGEPVEVELTLLDGWREAGATGLVPLGTNAEGYEEYWRNKDRAMVVRVPAGAFLMGSPPDQGEAHERPQHEVDLSAFLIDKTEVTWRQFGKFAQDQGRQLPRAPLWGRIDEYPVSFVLWEEAAAYCKWVGGRLPTEAEWEKAARGTDGRKYPWGNDWDQERCNSIQGGPHRPRPVGDFPSCVSPYGALDMAGSMWEWSADRHGAGYYADSPRKDPQGPASGMTRVMRGGAWMSHYQWLRTAHRFKAPPTTRHAHHGFRCAQDAPE